MTICRAFGGWFVLAVMVLAVDAHAAESFVFHHENVMGTSLDLRIYGGSAASAALAEQRILGEIDRLSAIFSGYSAASEFTRWSAQPAEFQKVAPELYQVLEASDLWNLRSQGAFDPRVEILTRLWTTSAKLGRTPTAKESEQALAQMRQPAWTLDPIHRSARRVSTCPITLNAIAKGEIVERAARAGLDPDQGVVGISLNVGGDMRVIGDLTEVVGIAAPQSDSDSSEPLAHIAVRNKAIATSGRSQRGLMIEGKWYSHIFNPATGQPAPGVAVATVIADRSRDADALATICNVLEPRASLELIDSLVNVDAWIVTRDGQVFKSKNWSRHERGVATPLALLATPRTTDVRDAPPKVAHWGDTYELAVDLAIAEPQEAKGNRYRRPYVAVWIEDAHGLPVRTLTLWIGLGGSGPDRWLPDLKRWYRPDEVKTLVEKKNMVYLTARPTRSPGNYAMVWDGKDDDGKPLPLGEYTIYLESAREQGPYSITQKTVTIADTIFDEEIKANVEFKSAKVAYRRKAPGK